MIEIKGQEDRFLTLIKKLEYVHGNLHFTINPVALEYSCFLQEQFVLLS